MMFHRNILILTKCFNGKSGGGCYIPSSCGLCFSFCHQPRVSLTNNSSHHLPGDFPTFPPPSFHQPRVFSGWKEEHRDLGQMVRVAMVHSQIGTFAFPGNSKGQCFIPIQNKTKSQTLRISPGQRLCFPPCSSIYMPQYLVLTFSLIKVPHN